MFLCRPLALLLRRGPPAIAFLDALREPLQKFTFLLFLRPSCIHIIGGLMIKISSFFFFFIFALCVIQTYVSFLSYIEISDGFSWVMTKYDEEKLKLKTISTYGWLHNYTARGGTRR